MSYFDSCWCDLFYNLREAKLSVIFVLQLLKFKLNNKKMRKSMAELECVLKYNFVLNYLFLRKNV